MRLKGKCQIFLQETREQELHDQNELEDSLLEPEKKKQGNLFLHNFLLLVQLFLMIWFVKYNMLSKGKVCLQILCDYSVSLFVHLLICLFICLSTFNYTLESKIKGGGQIKQEALKEKNLGRNGVSQRV